MCTCKQHYTNNYYELSHLPSQFWYLCPGKNRNKTAANQSLAIKRNLLPGSGLIHLTCISSPLVLKSDIIQFSIAGRTVTDTPTLPLHLLCASGGRTFSNSNRQRFPSSIFGWRRENRPQRHTECATSYSSRMNLSITTCDMSQAMEAATTEPTLAPYSLPVKTSRFSIDPCSCTACLIPTWYIAMKPPPAKENESRGGLAEERGSFSSIQSSLFAALWR